MAQIRPWIIDAKDLETSSSFRDFRSSLLHSNSLIERFLSDKSSRDLLVVAPKGYGKTLLLKLKRKMLENSGFRMLPENSLLDKPIGTPHIFQYREFESLLDDMQYWKTLWLVAIITVVLRSERVDISGVKTAPLKNIYNNDRLTSVCDIFDRVIGFSKKDYFMTYEDLKGVLIPEFRLLHTPIAIFIDNVDEYFEHAIAFGETPVVGKTIKRSYWYYSQYALAIASRELNGINSHVKVCASIRKEVFQNEKEIDPLAAQLVSSSFEIMYAKEDVLEILKKNIIMEDQSRLADSRSVDPYDRFFGVENRHIYHHYTGEDESIEEFFIRHTLWRPRDIAIIGKKISDTPPNRRTVASMRELINAQGTFIAQTYLAECRPHVSNLVEEVLYPLLPSNVLSRAELLVISKEYDDKLNELRGTAGKENHAFYDMYSLGLLGYVRETNRSQGAIQHFQAPGETSLDIGGHVPSSKNYLVHPILYETIARYNHKFFENIDTLNIVGKSRPWRAESEVVYCLMGDVAKYSEIMANADLADVFPKYFTQLVEELCKNLLYASTNGGDGLLLLDRNWRVLTTVANAIEDKLCLSVFRRNIRFGGDAGIIRFDEHDGKLQNLRGGALRTAARLEAAGIPGEIIVTERFMHYAGEEDSIAFRELGAEDLPKAKFENERFNLAKNESDESIYHRIFKLQKPAK